MRSTALDSPYDSIASPWAVDSLRGLMSVVAAASIIVVGLCLIASAIGLVRAWRRAHGQRRQQLLWLVAGALPLAPCVIASFAASYAGHTEAAGYLMSVAILALAAGAALSVLRYRLYDVERVVTDSAAYAMASASVVVIFAVVIVVISKTTPIDPRAQLPTILATLAGRARLERCGICMLFRSARPFQPGQRSREWVARIERGSWGRSRPSRATSRTSSASSGCTTSPPTIAGCLPCWRRSATATPRRMVDR